jgi:hypothetical protein
MQSSVRLKAIGLLLSWQALLCGGAVHLQCTVAAEPQAPPPALPIQRSSAVRAFATAGTAGNIYSIGDPSDDEQLYLEFINRARANPPSEGALLKSSDDRDVLGAFDFFDVDVNLMFEQFSQIPPVPPLAFNAKLIEAARFHTADMLQNVFQGHTNSTDGALGLKRVQATGYDVSQTGENVFSFARNTFHGHAGFEVDWGFGPGGMQTPPGHRDNIHSAVFREVGVGVIFGNNSKPGVTSVGPQLVTQDFAVSFADSPFITGVVYYDLNGDGFYSLGEGIGGINVSVSGQTISGVTALSGGYAVPISGDGSYTVTFSAPAVPNVSKTVTVKNRENVKMDLVLSYQAPILAGTATPAIGRANVYQITPVPGAVSYDVRTFQVKPTVVEGAENGTVALTLQTNGVYNVFDTQVKNLGDHSFHLAHFPLGENLGPQPQIITLSPSFFVESDASLWFRTRLGVATTDQKALAQISTDDGVTWKTLFSQVGATVPGGVVSLGEQDWTVKMLPLKEYLGKLVRVRFVYDFSSGSYFPGANLGVGWYLEDITFLNVKEAVGLELQSTPLNQFILSPAGEQDLIMQARPRVGEHILAFGDTLGVHSVLGQPEVAITASRTLSRTQLEISFELRSGKAPASYRLESRNDLSTNAAWSPENGAAFTPMGNNKFNFTALLTRGISTRFYRVVAN